MKIKRFVETKRDEKREGGIYVALISHAESSGFSPTHSGSS